MEPAASVVIDRVDGILFSVTSRISWMRLARLPIAKIQPIQEQLSKMTSVIQRFERLKKGSG